MEGKLKSITCYDMWVMFAIIFLSSGYISATPNNEPTVVNTITMGLGILYLFSIMIALIFCSRLKKYRYLLIYDNCEKIPKISKQLILALLIVAGILFLLTQTEFIKSSILYMSLAAILSYRHIDSEDKI